MILDNLQNDFIEIGQIMKPFGIKGELKVHFYIDDIHDLKDVKEFYIKDKNQDSGFRSLQFTKINFDKNPAYAKILFTDIIDRTMAESWRLKYLFIKKECLPSLNKGEYFIKDLIGLQVIYKEKDIGIVTNILDVGGQDIFITKIDTLKQELAIPFNNNYLDKICIEEKKIFFFNLDELF